ncbi:Cullin-4A [Lucilia cuprina]|nr:Cullin-4A [Lucilia cuprina]
MDKATEERNLEQILDKIHGTFPFIHGKRFVLKPITKRILPKRLLVENLTSVEMAEKSMLSKLKQECVVVLPQNWGLFKDMELRSYINISFKQYVANMDWGPKRIDGFFIPSFVVYIVVLMIEPLIEEFVRRKTNIERWWNCVVHYNHGPVDVHRKRTEEQKATEETSVSGRQYQIDAAICNELLKMPRLI